MRQPSISGHHDIPRALLQAGWGACRGPLAHPDWAPVRIILRRRGELSYLVASYEDGAHAPRGPFQLFMALSIPYNPAPMVRPVGAGLTRTEGDQFMDGKQRGFTLIEILVVVTIIGV
ncbi:MAG: type II secretion system protein, partial [Planctomycetota bacterium]